MQSTFRLVTFIVALSTCCPFAGILSAKEVEQFDRTIAPVFASYCLDCHSGEEPKGGLNLSSRQAAMRGGESGVAIAAGKIDESLLWERVSNGEMPPKEKLPEDAKESLRQWIAGGAKWGTDPIDTFRYTTSKRAGYDWWALQPLGRHDPPKVKAGDRVRNPIDAFLLAKLEEQNLAYSPDTDLRVVARRLYFDLTGLPPSPADTQALSEEAIHKVVDRLLDSPHYGERWGRHWLDVVRFGESDGFERNNPRKNFWPYRDWVIEALNADMPYDEFARMQIAGDLLTDNSSEGLASVGFLVAGVHNTVVGGSEFMKRLAKQDELEEVVGAVSQTFVGLTANCGRCHDHKFDPIRQEEFYKLAASISGVQHGEREVPMPEAEAELKELQKVLADVTKEIEAINTVARKIVLAERKTGKADPPKPPAPYASWEFDKDLNDGVGSLHGEFVSGGKLENGALIVDGKGHVATGPLPDEIGEKTLEAWVLLDNLDQRGGAPISIQTLDGVYFDAIVFGEREPKRWMAGSNGFVRTQSFAGLEETEVTKKPVHFALVYTADTTITGYRNGVPYGKPYKSGGFATFKPNEAQIVFGMRHLPAGSNKMLSGQILKAQLYDRALSPAAVAASAGVGSDYVGEEELVAKLNEQQRAARKGLIDRRNQMAAQEKKLSESSKRKIYTVNAGNPGTTQLLPRGDAMASGPLVTPGAIAAVTGVEGDFGLKPDAPEADRRRKLAEWLTDRNNPLFARVIVNRLWHYHFGIGIVETPNDFGFNGGRPSHPELLDWLAGKLIENDYRLKPIHRLIATSTAYRQSSKFNEDAARLDAGNRLLWRKSPQRLEAEVLRDSILQISGKLNAQRGGPGFEDVTITPNNGTTYYEPFDKEDENLNRRTVYRFWPRGGRSALLDTFDCPDPSATAPRRTVTTTPLQALSLLNNAFVLRMSDHLAKRVEQDAGDHVAKQVERAYQLVYSRDPDDEEQELASALVREHGIASLARALFNSNELVVIE
jgi:hypothetical protein